MLRSSKCFLANYFEMPFSEGIPKVVLRVTSRLSKTFVHRSQIFSFLSFLCEPNCSHQFATAPFCLNWFTEWLIRNKSSVFDESPLKCMVSLTFLPVQDSTTPSTNAFERVMTGFFESLYHFICCGVPVSIGKVRGFSIPLLVRSRTQKRPASLQESHRVILHFFCIRYANLIISFLCPIDVVEHWHEDDPVCEFFRFDALFKSRWISWRIRNDEIPGKMFHSNSIASPSIPNSSSFEGYILNSSTWPSHLFIASLLSFICPTHRHALLPLHIWSLDHEIILISPRTVMNIPDISHSEFLQECSKIHFWVVKNKLPISSKFVFL